MGKVMVLCTRAMSVVLIIYVLAYVVELTAVREMLESIQASAMEC